MPDTIKSHTHIGQVDYVRSIASCAVALFHLGGKTLPGLRYGWLGVEMFFLLSGFIICWSIPQYYSYRNTGTFIGKRIIRIEPPYLASIIFVLAVHFCWDKNYHINWHDLLGHLAYINSFNGRPYLSPVYWTLGIEFQFYILIALCFPFIISKWGSWLLLVLCIIPLLLPGWSILNNFFPLFALGILYFLYLKRLKKTIEVVLFAIAITIIGVYTEGWLIMTCGLLTLFILMMPLKQNGIISFLSMISFSLYLTHDVIGSNVVIIMGMHLPKTFLFKGLSFITGIAVSLLVAFVFYKLVEEPCVKLSKRIKYAVK